MALIEGNMKHHDSEGIDVGDAIVAGVISDYDRIPRYLYKDETLGIGEFITYAVLLRYAGIGRDNGRGIFPGIEKLAELTRSSTASVKRRLVQLVKRGWVSSKRRGLNQTNLYRVHGPHAKYSGLGSGITAANLRDHLDAKQTDPSGEIKMIHQEGSEISDQEGSFCATSTKSVEYEEFEYLPLTPQGAPDTGSSADDVSPNPQIHRRQRGESRYAREADDAYWTASGDDSADLRKRFAAIWEAHPRQEDRQGAMRAWRSTLGTDPLHEGLMRLIWYLHQNAKRTWAGRAPEMVPKLDTWLSRRPWEEHQEWPLIEEQIAQGYRCKNGDAVYVPSLPDVSALPESPPRPAFMTQADHNAARRNSDGSVVLVA